MQNGFWARLIVLRKKHEVTAQYHRTISKTLNNKQYKGNNYLHVQETKM
jgi:hypothetical protein